MLHIDSEHASMLVAGFFLLICISLIFWYVEAGDFGDSKICGKYTLHINGDTSILTGPSWWASSSFCRLRNSFIRAELFSTPVEVGWCRSSRITVMLPSLRPTDSMKPSCRKIIGR